MMKRTALLTVLCVGLCAWGSHARAAEDFSYQVSNLTLSGGDPIFPVASDVTFTDLHLSETFDGINFVDVPLFTPSGSPATSLDTSTLFLNSGYISQNNPEGSVKEAILTGDIDLSSLDIQTSFGGSKNTVSVSDPSFSAIFNGPISVGDSAFITITDDTGVSYNLGLIGATAVPEPGTVAFAMVTGLSGASLLIRRRRK